MGKKYKKDAKTIKKRRFIQGINLNTSPKVQKFNNFIKIASKDLPLDSLLYCSKNFMARKLAIGDIHGCNKTFKMLLIEVLKIKKQDQLILLGDYIDRGPDSLGVIQTILKLQNE